MKTLLKQLDEMVIQLTEYGKEESSDFNNVLKKFGSQASVAGTKKSTSLTNSGYRNSKYGLFLTKTKYDISDVDDKVDPVLDDIVQILDKYGYRKGYKIQGRKLQKNKDEVQLSANYGGIEIKYELSKNSELYVSLWDGGEE